jgi:hypothetical protein
MPTATKKTDLGRSRSNTLNMRIEPKLKYLALLGARELDISLSRFIERAIERALTVEAMQEPNVSEPTGPKQLEPLYNDGLWDESESDRFFKLAAFRHDLLIPAEQRFWKLFTLNYVGKQFTLKDFREFWNDPSINTSHLDEGDE